MILVPRMLRISVLCGLASCVGGCALLKQQPPAEQIANRVISEAVVPAIRGGLRQGVDQLSIQGGAQGINPTYVVEFDGKWVVGIEGRASIGLEGVAGQIQVSSASGGADRE